MLASGLLARNAVKKGLKTKPWVKTSLAPGSKVVTDYLRQAGVQEYLDQLGFNLVGYGCTTCIGNSGPLPDEIASAIEQGKLFVASVLSGNRNFEGRVNPLTRYNYRVIAPREWSDKVLGKDWADLVDLPWITTPHTSAHRRLIDEIFRPTGSLPKRVAFAEQEDAMIECVEAGNCLSLARDCVIDRITRKRNFVIADKVALTCDLSFVCLTSRRHEPMISQAFSAMRTVWELTPDSATPAPIEAARSRRSVRR